MNGYNPLAGMGQASEAQKLPLVPPGAHQVQIDRCTMSQGPKGIFFVCECTIVASNNPASPVGSRHTYLRGFTYIQSAQGELKAFCLAVLGLRAGTPEADQYGPHAEAYMTQAIGPQNAFAGRRMRMDGETKITGKGKAITVYRFSPFVQGETLPAMAQVMGPAPGPAYAPPAGPPPGFAAPPAQAWAPPGAPPPAFGPPVGHPPPGFPSAPQGPPAPPYGPPQAAFPGQPPPQAYGPPAGPPAYGPPGAPPMPPVPPGFNQRQG